MISISCISGYYTVLFLTLENMGVAFIVAILNAVLLSMLRIVGDCTIVFPTSKSIGAAVEIVLVSQFLPSYICTSVFFKFSSRHLGFSTDIDVVH